MSRLVTEPAAGAELTVQYRHPSLACEVLQCAIPAVLDRLAADCSLLERLCALLRQPAPLNPLLASFLSRTLTLLISKKTEQVRSRLAGLGGMTAGRCDWLSSVVSDSAPLCPSCWSTCAPRRGSWTGCCTIWAPRP